MQKVASRAAPALRGESLKELFRTDPKKAEKVLNAYYENYAKAFPDPDELTSKADLRRDLKDPDAGNWDVTFFSDKKGAVVAGAHTNVLETPRGKFGVIEYLWTAPDSRRRGVGSEAHASVVAKMKDEAGGALKGVFMEVNDPRLMTEEQKAADSIRPEQRLKFWGEKTGYQALDAPYIQPPLDESSNAVTNLMPAYLPLDGATSMSSSEYKHLLQAYFETWVDGDVRKDPSYQTIVQGVRGASIALVPMSAPRSAVADQFVVEKSPQAAPPSTYELDRLREDNAALAKRAQASLGW